MKNVAQSTTFTDLELSERPVFMVFSPLLKLSLTENASMDANIRSATSNWQYTADHLTRNLRSFPMLLIRMSFTSTPQLISG